MTISPDMPPPSLEPYDLPRGTCPRCGSDLVRHHVIGMPMEPEVMDFTPEWVEWEGCLHPGYTRSCCACHLTWTDDEDDDL